MFEWLEREISAIKTPRFHLIEGPVEPKFQEAVLNSELPLPLSYREFVLKFGNAKLYRRSRNGYRITVLAGPREKILNDGTRIYQIGFHDSAGVFVMPTDNATKFPIFESELDVNEKVADDFESWLAESCAFAREAYAGKKWEEILHGPEPFTPEEQKIIEARQQIHWRVRGVDPVGNHIFEVTNNSGCTLPILTVGASSKNKHLNGAIRLKIGHVSPGQTSELHVACYKDVVPPQEIELFALPDPQPEDRRYYGEFSLN